MILKIIFWLMVLAGGALVLATVFCVLRSLYRFIFLRFHYSDARQSVGEITDMDYTPPRYVSNGKTTTYHAEKNTVNIKTDQKHTEIDSDDLYQRCRIGDKVKLTYQVRYAEPRFWNGELSLDGFRLISVRCPRKQIVNFNNEKPVSRKVSYLEEISGIRK
jgi:hypothetical protein